MFDHNRWFSLVSWRCLNTGEWDGAWSRWCEYRRECKLSLGRGRHPGGGGWEWWWERALGS